MKTLLVTGASGLAGSYVCREGLKKGFRTVGMYNSNQFEINGVIPVKCDFSDFDELMRVFEDFKPDWVVHCGALTPVDFCEENEDLAMSVNFKGTLNVVEACKRFRCALHYLSSTYVFDGTKTLYSEIDIPNPVNVYGRSKLAPEKSVLDVGGVVIRMSVVFGWNPFGRMNFATWLIDSLKKEGSVNLFTDMFSSPTYAGLLVKVLFGLFEKGSKGVFHVGCSDRVSRFEFGELLCDVFGFGKSLLNPVSFGSVAQRTMRPVDDSVSPGKVEEELGFKMPRLKECFDLMKKEKF